MKNFSFTTIIKAHVVIGLIFVLISIMVLMVDRASGEENMANSKELLEQGDDLFKVKEYDKAIKIYKQAVNTAEEGNNNSDLVEALSQVARCYLALNKNEEGRVWLKKAEDKATDNEPSGWSRYLSVRGRYEWKDGISESGEFLPEVRIATDTFKEMYAYCFEHSLFSRAVDATNMISLTGTADERIEWGLKGIKAAENGGFEGWLGPLWNNLGWNYNELKRYDEALESLKKAREYHYKKGDDLAKLIADWSVGHAYRKTGQLDSAFVLMQEVFNWSMKRYEEDSSPDNAEWVGHSCRELGELSLSNGKLEKALEYLVRAKENLAIAGMADWDAKGFKELSDQITQLKADIK